MLLSLLNLASTTAFSIIISISTFGLYQSYIVAISCILYARLAGRMDTVSPPKDLKLVYSRKRVLLTCFLAGAMVAWEVGPVYQRHRHSVLGLDGNIHGISHIASSHRSDYEREYCYALDARHSLLYRVIADGASQYALPLNAFVWVLGLVTWVIWANKHWDGLDENVIKEVMDDTDREKE